MKLEEMRRVCEAATPGPWRFKREDEPGEVREAVVFGVDTVSEGCVSDRISLYREEDARFIAMARAVIPKLLAVAEAAKADFEDYPEELKRTHAALAALEAEL